MASGIGSAFKDLGGGGLLSDATLAVIETLGFKRATPVQEAVIPLFCGNKDVAVDACTGSGKTLAFLVPIVVKLRRLDEPLKKHQVGAVVVSPTRELARQIHEVAAPFVASVPGLSSLLLVGGSDPAQDVAAFKQSGGHVMIGTPGRIEDVMKRCPLMDFKRLEVLVLDEADRLLDMGFQKQIDAIMSRLPKQRRTGLFSATQTEAVKALARAGLRNPVRVNVAVTAAPAPAANGKKSDKSGPQSPTTGRQGQGAGNGPTQDQKTPTGLSLSYVVCGVEDKLSQLVRFLQSHAAKEKVIVYFLTCACVDFYALALRRLTSQFKPGIQVCALHGRMKQAAREGTLEAFAARPAGVLLATDLAARGLDIPEVNWVVQVDPPQDPAAFVHRVGRTARAGRTGAALVYLTPSETTYVEFLRLRKVPMTESQPLTDAPDVLTALRREAETDREVMEAGMKAFVSYIRGYKEHHCRFIFRVSDLPIGRLATAFALLRLPHMPEVKKALVRGADGTRAAGIPTCEGFTPSDIDPDTVAFRDKKKEKQRQQVLKQRAAKAEASKDTQRVKSGASAGPSGHTHTDNHTGAHQGDDKTPGAKLTAQKRRKLQARDEMAELDAEYRLLKKLKRGKLTDHEFDVATGLSTSDDEDDLNLNLNPGPSHKQGPNAHTHAHKAPAHVNGHRKGQQGGGDSEDSEMDSDMGGVGSDSGSEDSDVGVQGRGSKAGAGQGQAHSQQRKGQGGKGGGVKGVGGIGHGQKGGASEGHHSNHKRPQGRVVTGPSSVEQKLQAKQKKRQRKKQRKLRKSGGAAGT